MRFLASSWKPAHPPFFRIQCVPVSEDKCFLNHVQPELHRSAPRALHRSVGSSPGITALIHSRYRSLASPYPGLFQSSSLVAQSASQSTSSTFVIHGEQSPTAFWPLACLTIDIYHISVRNRFQDCQHRFR